MECIVLCVCVYARALACPTPLRAASRGVQTGGGTLMALREQAPGRAARTSEATSRGVVESLATRLVRQLG